uniref:Uncharacterized protein n=1 Tax=Anopheles minimus TaxID=112268 RepID=A0A182VU86_9DIPT
MVDFDRYWIMDSQGLRLRYSCRHI